MPITSDDSFYVIRRTLLLDRRGGAIIFLFVWYTWEVLFLAFAGLLLAIILLALADWIEHHIGLGPRLSFTAHGLRAAYSDRFDRWFIVPRVISRPREYG